jgi:hypothetical protein
MEAGWVARVRWRRRGAWLWPAFAVLTVADAVVVHLLPLSGESESWAPGAVIGLCLNVVGVLLLSRPLGAAIRRWRPDLPGVVARNYGGTCVVLAVFLALTAVGLVHHQGVMSDRRAIREATARAQAWIGDRAPAAYRRNLAQIDTFAIQPGSIYRSCVPSLAQARVHDYCVIVNLSAPFPGGVRFAGSEPNAVFAQGVG